MTKDYGEDLAKNLDIYKIYKTLTREITLTTIFFYTLSVSYYTGFFGLKYYSILDLFKIADHFDISSISLHHILTGLMTIFVFQISPYIKYEMQRFYNYLVQIYKIYILKKYDIKKLQNVEYEKKTLIFSIFIVLLSILVAIYFTFMSFGIGFYQTIKLYDIIIELFLCLNGAVIIQSIFQDILSKYKDHIFIRYIPEGKIRSLYVKAIFRTALAIFTIILFYVYGCLMQDEFNKKYINNFLSSNITITTVSNQQKLYLIKKIEYGLIVVDPKKSKNHEYFPNIFIVQYPEIKGTSFVDLSKI